MTRWKTIESKVFFESPWMTFKHNVFEMPNGKRGNYYFVSTRGSSMVVPILPDGRILLTRQYRYLVDEESVEFPAGGVKKNQDHLAAAKGELEEESGYRAGELKYVGNFVPMNGVTDEVCHVYLASGLTPVGQILDETEDINVFFRSPEEIDAMIKENKIQDGMTLAAWALARFHLKPKT